MASTPASAPTSGSLERIAPEWVIFGCSGERFALPLSRVREILVPLPLTRIPGCGPEVCGLVGLRGRLLTVFDFGAALGQNPSISVEEHRLLLIEYGEELIAGAVDEIVAITHEHVQLLDLDELLGRLMG